MKQILYPASIDWEVTPFCNHNCIHCYNCWRSSEDKKQDVYFNNRVDENYFLELASLIIKNKPASVIITGGEPLSVFWKILPAIKLFKQNNIYVSMNSNITLLDREKAREIKSLEIPIFTSVISSNEEHCDKITNVKGSFHCIDKSLRLCIEYGIPITTNMVVTKTNLGDIEETAKYIYDLGLRYFCCTKAAFPANALPVLKDEILSYDEFVTVLDKLLLLKQEYGLRVDSAWAYSLCGLCNEHISEFGFKRRCGAGRFNFAITCSGDIKACNVDTEVYGNLFEDNDFSNAIEKMVIWQNGSLLPPECKECKSLMLCGGGCRLEAKNTFGKIDVLDSTAKRENVGRIVEPPIPFPFDKKKKLMLNDEVYFLQDISCVRISRRSQYEFITYECFDFLSRKNIFSVEEFQEELGLCRETAKNELSNLLEKQLLTDM